MKRGDSCQVRVNGGRWVDAELIIVSGNQKSIGLVCDQTLAPGKGFLLDPEKGRVVFLLLREGDEWLDLVSGQTFELKHESGS